MEALITKPAVERALLARLKKKAALYGQDLGPDGHSIENGGSTKIDVEGVQYLYEKYIIPLTKDVEVGVYNFSGLILKNISLFPGGLPLAALGWSVKSRN